MVLRLLYISRLISNSYLLLSRSRFITNYLKDLVRLKEIEVKPILGKDISKV